MNLPAQHTPPNAFSRFFFAQETPFGLALVRIFLPIACGIPMFMRFRHARELYTADGSPVQMFELFGHSPVLPILPPNIAIPLYSLMLACFVLTVVGFKTRISCLVTTILYIYFNFMDGVGTMTKYSAIASHLLVLLSVSNAGAIWSVDAFLARKRQSGAGLPVRTSIWPARLMQIMFAHVYFGAAITKIQTDSFFSGEQMRYWMLSNWNYENPVGEAMAMWSPVLLLSAYMAVIWEMTFPFLVWRPKARLFALSLGVFFHFMTWLTLGLYIFPAICVSGYFAFVSEADFMKVRSFFHRIGIARYFKMPVVAGTRLLERMPTAIPSGVVWMCLIAITAIGGTEAELQLDLYGRNLAEGGYRLKSLDHRVATTMIRDEQVVREKDKFFSFEIGTRTVGSQLANRRDEYEFGETMIAQANLNPPHEDMWIECLLQDSDGRNIEQFGQFVTREMMWSNFVYKFGNKLLPGEYKMVLKSANKEIYSRPFRLTGTPDEQYGFSQAFTN